MKDKKSFYRKSFLYIFGRAELFFTKYKEPLLYLFFGGLTFLISVISFVLLNLFCGVNELIANILSWILAVIFAFFTNKIWVFNASTNTIIEFLIQMMAFLSGRAVTLILEEVILYIFISRLNFSSVAVKIVAQVIVIVLNYGISKICVFKGVD